VTSTRVTGIDAIALRQADFDSARLDPSGLCAVDERRDPRHREPDERPPPVRVRGHRVERHQGWKVRLEIDDGQTRRKRASATEYAAKQIMPAATMPSRTGPYDPLASAASAPSTLTALSGSKSIAALIRK